MPNDKPSRSGKPGVIDPGSSTPSGAPKANSSRRRFLQGLGAAAGLAAAPGLLRAAEGFGNDKQSPLFSLGVASGDPGFRWVVLWTRLAPDPLSDGGGMPARAVPVTYEVATDPGMFHVIRRGHVVAHPAHGHTVNVLVNGLPSNSWLYYRFQAMGERSRIGRTRTFPSPRDPVERLRLAVANCQNYAQGYYPAYRDMLTQDLDCIVHVGDYMYEGAEQIDVYGIGRTHNGAEPYTVEDYRKRYALYRLDPDLQDAHAHYPFLVTWDDHEVENNYASFTPEESSEFQGGDFFIRRRNAYQVYSETMPLHPRARQRGSNPRMRLYRSFRFGSLANLFLLDTRQYRSDQPAGDDFGSTDPDSRLIEPFTQQLLGDGNLYDPEGIQDPDATLLGRAQEQWLERSLQRSRATWNILAQQVMVMPWNLTSTARAAILGAPGLGDAQRDALLEAAARVDNLLNVDAWDGYPAARERLLGMLERIRPGNPVVLTGDIHSAWCGNLLADFSDPDASDMLAAELVSTSISSTFLDIDPRPTDFIVRQSLADNPHIAYFNGLFRGYCLCDFDTDRCRTTYRAAVPDNWQLDPSPTALVPFSSAANPSRADTPVTSDAVFEVSAGFNTPGSTSRLTRIS